MRKGIAVVCVVAVLGIAIWWLRKDRGSDTPATPELTQSGSGSSSHGHDADEPSTTATLAVSVRDEKGPIAHARVRIAPEGGDVTVVETDTNGTTTIDSLAAGKYAVSASASGHEPAADHVELESGEARKLALVLASGGQTLSGTVTDASGGGGGPIAGVRIDAAKLGGMARPGAAIATTFTDADGHYAMTVPEGHLLVAARSLDYAAQSRYVEVGPKGATADFALVPGGVIEGVVLDDRSKQPVSGAMVSARRDSASIMLAERGVRVVTTRGDGRFRITGLRPGAYELGATAKQRRTRVPTQIGLGVAEQITDVELLVGTTPVVRGKVIDETKAPVANATIRPMDGAGGNGSEVTSDDKGAFAISGLSPGSHVLFATSDTHLMARPATFELADKDLDGVVIEMKRGGRVVGHVEPRQADCAVELEPVATPGPMMMLSMIAPVTTKADGTFELGPIAPGKLSLSARCASGDQGTLVTPWDRTSPELVLAVSPGASIAGKVIDGNGKPVEGVTVMASPQGPSSRTTIVNGLVTSGIQGVTGAAGTYELRGLAPGKYRMGALDRGRPMRLRKEPPTVALAAAQHQTGVDLAVDRPDGVIKGLVVGPDGKPLADAWVSVNQDLDALIESAMGGHRGPRGPGPGGKPAGAGGPGGPDGADGPSESRMITVTESDDGQGGAAGGYPPVLTDAQGRFAITGLPHLEFGVIAEAQGGKLRGRAAAVTPDAEITIKALGVTSLSGTVRGPHGPATLFTVELDGPTRTQRSFTDGTFSLGRVDPGDYTVHVRSSEGNGEAKVTVVPDTPATVDIALVANAVVIGTVVDEQSKPVPNVPVVVVDDAGDGQVQVSIEGPPPTTGPDGTFRIERKAGRGMLVVMTGPKPVTKPGLVLEAGKTLDAGTIQIESREP